MSMKLTCSCGNELEFNDKAANKTIAAAFDLALTTEDDLLITCCNCDDTIELTGEEE